MQIIVIHISHAIISSKINRKIKEQMEFLWNVTQYIADVEITVHNDSLIIQKSCWLIFELIPVNLFICTLDLKGNISGMEIMFILCLIEEWVWCRLNQDYGWYYPYNGQNEWISFQNKNITEFSCCVIQEILS